MAAKKYTETKMKLVDGHSTKYSLLPNKRPGGKKSDKRRVWHFMERGD